MRFKVGDCIKYRVSFGAGCLDHGPNFIVGIQNGYYTVTNGLANSYKLNHEYIDEMCEIDIEHQINQQIKEWVDES